MLNEKLADTELQLCPVRRHSEEGRSGAGRVWVCARSPSRETAVGARVVLREDGSAFGEFCDFFFPPVYRAHGPECALLLHCPHSEGCAGQKEKEARTRAGVWWEPVGTGPPHTRLGQLWGLRQFTDFTLRLPTCGMER